MKSMRISLPILILCSILFAGTTGKLKGTITDEEGNSLAGANIILENTILGTAADELGQYTLLNIPPGIYTVRVTMMGYKSIRYENVSIHSDLTTTVNASMAVEVLKSQDEVTVIASRPMIQKDATASAAIIGADVIESSPIESFQEIVKTKAGITEDAGGELHFRGGRSNEVAYLIDGIPNVNPYHAGLGVQVSTNAIQELSIITGAFSAEYGQAMSGVVNIITKEPGRKFHGSLSMMSGDMVTDYAIDSSRIVRDAVKPFDLTSSREIEATLSGPLPFLNKVGIFTSARINQRSGTLFGVSRYNSYGGQLDSSEWKAFPLNPRDDINLQAKMNYFVSDNIKLQYTYLMENSWWKSYSHSRRFLEEGHQNNYKTAWTQFLRLTHQIGEHNFYSLGAAFIQNNYKYFAYKDEYDLRYVADHYYDQDDNYEFYTGGTNNSRYKRNIKSTLFQGQLTSQWGNSHEIKAGFEFRQHNFEIYNWAVSVDTRAEPWTDVNSNGVWDTEEPYTDQNQNGVWDGAGDENADNIYGNIVVPESSLLTNSLKNHPQEFSAYVQDKIELVDMVMNLGIRLDRYNPDGKIAADWNDPHPDNTKKASAKIQFSPRFSLAYPITTTGKLFFSYGHFFQMPSYQYLFQNAEFKVLPGVIKSDIGNADLKPQKTISYEVGFEQAITYNSAVYLKMFYRDMRNLLGQKIYVLPSGSDSYALFINRDWGNTKGITLSFDQRFTSFLSGSVDYTYMVAVGNESNPSDTRTDYRLSIEPKKKVVPLDWDQTNAFRFVLNMRFPGGYQLSSIGIIESGYPYTPKDANAIVQIAEENSGRKPMRKNIDLTLHKSFKLGTLEYKVFGKVYNLLDYRNENYVWDSSGRAGYSLGRFGDESTSNWINRPNWYSTPRQIFFGLELNF